MSRLSKESSETVYEPPFLFGLDSLDSYLTTLDGIIKEKIKTVEKSRPISFSNEEESFLDGFIDEHIIGLGEIGQILIESALVAYYSYLESQLFIFCREIEPIQNNLEQRLKAIGKHNGDIDKYRKLILEHHNLIPSIQLEQNWVIIKNAHLIRKYIIHATLSKANRITLSNHVKSDPSIWHDPKHGSFAISMEYVKKFSSTISSFLTELDHLVYQKTGSNTLI
ncbi:MAG: hypothetical protein JNK66_05890 [Chitinophagales bacterium]|nr:hypothetical protein [Chitinophagales bacterium]